MKKKYRRLLVLVVAASLFSDIPYLAKMLIILPIIMALVIDYDDFNMNFVEKGMNKYE